MRKMVLTLGSSKERSKAAVNCMNESKNPRKQEVISLSGENSKNPDELINRSHDSPSPSESPPLSAEMHDSGHSSGNDSDVVNVKPEDFEKLLSLKVRRQSADDLDRSYQATREQKRKMPDCSKQRLQMEEVNGEKKLQSENKNGGGEKETPVKKKGILKKPKSAGKDRVTFETTCLDCDKTIRFIETPGKSG